MRCRRPRISTSRRSCVETADRGASPEVAPDDVSAVEVARLSASRRAVLDRIARACARAGREPASVELLAVTKTVPAERLRAAVAAGLVVLGENRVQEAVAKAPLVPGARWQLVGHLQRNKARQAVAVFEAMHTVDSLDLAVRLDRLAAAGSQTLRVYLQVNVDQDPTKAGFAPDAVAAAMEPLAALDHLELVGLMTVGRLAADPHRARPTFVRLRELSHRLRGRWPAALGGGLSMGMSDDFEVAVEEGATVVRVGRALFGERPAG